MRGFKLEQSKDNKKFFEMTAPEAELFRSEQIAKANFPETKLYQNSSKPVELKGSEAIAHMETHDIIFKGATEIKSPEGFLVQGRNLFYQHVERKVTTDEAIQFESTPEFKSSLIQGWGKGFEADLNVKSFTFHENVNINIIPREAGGSPSKIRGNSAKVFTEKGWAQIEGSVAFQNQNISLRSDFLTLDFDIGGKKSAEEATFQSSGKSDVVALFDDYKLSSKEVVLHFKNRKNVSQITANGEVALSDRQGLEMKTDRLEVANPQTKNRTMKFIGNVLFKRGQDEGKCDEAVYDPVSDLIHLKGNASFKHGHDMMSGREIKYSERSGQLQVIGAAGQMQKENLLNKRKQ